MTASNRMPERVARFYGNVDFALDTIANRQLTFIHVSKLNDPFDPYFFFDTQFNERYDAVVSYVSVNHPNDFGWFINAVPPENWNATIRNLKDYLERMRQSTFMFSTSGISSNTHLRDNLHMWGHYGNGHRGVLIEFDMGKLMECAKSANESASKKTNYVDDIFMKVEYKESIPLLTPRDIFLFYKSITIGIDNPTVVERYLNNTLRIKSADWKNENEWRMLWHNDETRLKVHHMRISEASIKKVYIGFNMTKTNSKDVEFETRRRFPNAQIIFAKRTPGAFGLEFMTA